MESRERPRIQEYATDVQIEFFERLRSGDDPVHEEARTELVKLAEETLAARGESHYSEHAAAAGKYVRPTPVCDWRRSSMRLVRIARSAATNEARSSPSTKQGRRRP